MRIVQKYLQLIKMIFTEHAPQQANMKIYNIIFHNDEYSMEDGKYVITDATTVVRSFTRKDSAQAFLLSRYLEQSTDIFDCYQDLELKCKFCDKIIDYADISRSCYDCPMFICTRCDQKNEIEEYDPHCKLPLAHLHSMYRRKDHMETIEAAYKEILATNLVLQRYSGWWKFVETDLIKD